MVVAEVAGELLAGPGGLPDQCSRLTSPVIGSLRSGSVSLSTADDLRLWSLWWMTIRRYSGQELGSEVSTVAPSGRCGEGECSLKTLNVVRCG